MIKIEVIQKGTSFRQLIAQLHKKTSILKSDINLAGDQTAEEMRKIIKENKVRPQAGEPTTLEDNIQVEHFDTLNGFGWGVGNIKLLNEKAPYWSAVNYGSSHMVGKLLPKGSFQPGEKAPNPISSRQGRWKKGLENFSAIIKNAIPAMNYIQKTFKFVGRKFRQIGLR